MDLPHLLVDVGAHATPELVQPPGAGAGGDDGGGGHVVHHLTRLLGEGGLGGAGELAGLGPDHTAVLDAGVVGAVVPPAASLPLPHLVPVDGDQVPGHADPVGGELAAVVALERVQPPEPSTRPVHQRLSGQDRRQWQGT